ncbi:ARM repeat-containing protein [Amylostereum chailletii]|nr:ARM repeat-containing protein [Amylostereum chailletii]
MDVAQRLIQTWVASPRSEEIEETASGITSGDIKLLHIVKGLGEYLTSENDDLRNKGVEFLAKVVGRCPPETFNKQSVKVLVTFFISKLEDIDTIIPALKGILALSPLPSLSDVDTIQLINALFTHVKMQALVQAQRLTVYSIFDTLMSRHREVLKGMGNQFLSGYIALADGEKDPRNLMVAFAIARVILIEFDIRDKVEDLFNITFCYFPIAFRPPPDDPYGITAEDLKKALSLCLSATPAFGPLAIPLFLEKIATVAPATKRDILRALDVCLPVYGAGTAHKFARKLWNALKLEIFQPTDPQTEEVALKTTQILIQTIYPEDDTGSTPTDDVEGLAKDACEECIQILKEPEKSQAKPSMKVLCAFVSTTPSVSRYTISHVVPHLVKLFLNPDELPNRGPTLKLLSSLIAAIRDSTLKARISPEAGHTSLAPYKDEVLGVLVTGLKVPSSVQPALEGLKAMVTTPGLFEDEELGFVVHNVNDIITGEREDAMGSSDAALDLLTTISSTAPTHVSQTTLPLLFSLLPDQAPPRDDFPARDKYWKTLASLAHLCIQPVLFETLVVRLSTKLDLLCGPTTPTLEDKNALDVEPVAAYGHAIMTTLANVLAKKVERGDVDVPKYIDRLVPTLFGILLSGTVAGTDSPSFAAVDVRLVSITGRIVNLIVQTASVQKQEAFVVALVALFFKGDSKAIATSHHSSFLSGTFLPFEENATELQANLVVLLSESLISLHKEVALPVEDQGGFLDTMINWSIHHAKNALQREAVWHIVASVVNKREQDLALFFTKMLESFWATHIQSSNNNLEARKLGIRVWTWIAKGLVVRNHPQAAVFVDRLFELFDDESTSWDAARAIGKIIATNRVLTKSNHAVLKILYAQRYSNSVLPRIITGAQSTAEPRRQTANLVALTSLIKSVPKTAYAHEMPTLMPLLLRGLELPDTEIRASVIETLLTAAQAEIESNSKNSKEDSIVASHASSLAATMLKNSSVSTMPDAKVRIAALRYLAILPKVVRYNVLHPQKATVIRGMSKILDDPKRAVRKEAVDAR